MARQVRDSSLETRTARSRLRPQHKPYFRLIEPGLHLGYRKPVGGGPGAWVVRRSNGAGGYSVQNLRAPSGELVLADDYQEADGVAILSFAQAQKAAAVERTVARAKAHTVDAALDAYFRFLQNDGRSVHSVNDAERRAQAFIRPELGSVKLAALTTERLRSWRDQLAASAPRLRTAQGEEQRHGAVAVTDDERRARRASTNRTWTVLVAALNHAFREGKVETDLAWRRIAPFRSVDSPRQRFLSIAECTRLINACDPDFRSLVQGALLTGCRYGELIALTVGDFVSDVGAVSIRRSKSGRPRHVTLSREGVQLFAQLVAGRAGAELMFRHSDGCGWKASQQARPMHAANARARITPPISFHGLRHSWCSHAVMGGVPLLVVAQHLGHADTRMVEKVYGHLSPSYVADAIRAGAPRFESIESDAVVPIAAGRAPKRP